MTKNKGANKVEVKKLNLYQKLVEVRKTIDAFHKDSKSFNYSYVSGTQVLSKIKEKMDEMGLLCFPSILGQSHEHFNYLDKYGKEKHDFIVYGPMVYRWINADNPEEVLEVPFEFMGQQDDISKAFGSGLTYSERYFLLKFFGVPTDDDDPDKKESPKQQQNNQSPKKAESLPKFEGITKDTKDLIKVLAEDVATKRSTDVLDSYYVIFQRRDFQLKDLDKLSEQDGKQAVAHFEKWINKLANKGKVAETK